MNYFNLVLDTTAPASPLIKIEGGLASISTQLVNANITTVDTPTTNYQIKIWGDVDPTFDTSVKTTEGASLWISYTATKQIKLDVVEGNKTVYLKIRDEVFNESSIVNAVIRLDTTMPVVTVTASDVPKVSKIAGKNVASFSFQSDSSFTDYMVKVVSAINATHDTGILILTTNGSTNMTATLGSFPANTPIACTIKGTDLEVASAGDGSKIIKVFVKEDSGNWSI